MSAFIVTVIAVLLALSYYSTMNKNIFENLTEEKRKKAKSTTAWILIGVVVVNFLTALMAKELHFLVYVLAVIYLTFLCFLILSVKTKYRLVQVYREDGEKKVDEETGEEIKAAAYDKEAMVKQIFALWYLSVPMAICVCLAKASIAKSPKGLVLSFVLPLLAVAIVGVIQYVKISGLYLTVINSFDSKRTDSERDVYSDSSRDPHSFANWWKRNWLIVCVVAFLAVCAITCLCVLHTNDII